MFPKESFTLAVRSWKGRSELHDDSWSSVPLNPFECSRDEWESRADRPEDYHLSVCAIVISGPSVETEHRIGTQLRISASRPSASFTGFVFIQVESRPVDPESRWVFGVGALRDADHRFSHLGRTDRRFGGAEATWLASSHGFQAYDEQHPLNWVSRLDAFRSVYQC
jgi:hypothetical protein